MSKHRHYNTDNNGYPTTEVEQEEIVNDVVEETAPEAVVEEEPVSVPAVEEPKVLETPVTGVVVNAPFVNVRRVARNDGEVIKVLPRGAIVKVYIQIGNHYEVSIDDYDGRCFISSEFLQIK